MSNQIILPRIIQLGKGSVEQLIQIMDRLNVSRPLIVTDKVMLSLGNIAKLEKLLADDGKEYAIYSDTIPEPTDTSIQGGIDIIRAGKFDSVIAIGGGSVIDSAKAIALVGKLGGTIRDYKFPVDITKPGLPLIAIPTTAGTGSEATRATIITDEKLSEKMLCSGAGLVPMVALVDYTLTLSVPKRVTADSGLDALTHAIESYVSQKANSFTDMQALSAIKLIHPNLRTAYFEPQNEKAREAMMLGAHLAGIAFANASVALVHGMSRPIGAHFHIPHGLSNAMLLPDITEFSIPSAEARYADCARAMGLTAANDSDKTACERLIAELKQLNQDLEVPTLQAFGVDREQFESLLDLMAEQALSSGSPANNPRQPTADEIVALYRLVYSNK